MGIPGAPGPVGRLRDSLTEAVALSSEVRAELDRVTAERDELARQLRDLHGIAADTGLTRRAQDTAIREYLASTEPEAQS